MVAGQLCAGVGAVVAAGQGDHPHHPGMLDQLVVEVVGVGQRELEHHLLILAKVAEVAENRCLELLFRRRPSPGYGCRPRAR